jgi:hypothetical protein
MSDPNFRDPTPRRSDRDFGVRGLSPDTRRDFANPPASPVSDRSYGAIPGLVAVVALLALAGLFYYTTRTDTALYAPTPTTGAAPLNEPRPAPIMVPEHPAAPTKSAQ